MSERAPDLPESRVDLVLIAGMIEPGTRVLDVGCGDGALLDLLRREKGVEGRGIDVERENVAACVSRGLSVIQGDADSDLDGYPDKAFDVVILSQTIQATRRPKRVIENLIRIGAKAVVTFPNFAHWRIRSQILFGGRMPVTRTIDYRWHDTPNIHLCTIKDFADLARDVGVSRSRLVGLDRAGRPFDERWPVAAMNLVAPQALFVLEKQ
jgi:methionine biosynthesis protein MetW